MASLSIPWDIDIDSHPTSSPSSRRTQSLSITTTNNRPHQPPRIVTMASLMLAPGQSFHQPQIDLHSLNMVTTAQHSFSHSPFSTFTFSSHPPHFHPGGTTTSDRRQRQSSAATTSSSISSSSSSDQDLKPSLASSVVSTSASASTAPSSASPSSDSPRSSASLSGEIAVEASSGGGADSSFSHWNSINASLGGLFGGIGIAGSSSGGPGAECLACGYRYSDLGLLADHQRMEHGLVDVVF